MSEILQMSAIELGRAIKNGDLSTPEAVRMQLDAIRQMNDCNAFITVLGDEALKRAADVQKQIESGELDSALAGVPVVLKDNICTKGVKTSCASRILGDFRPPYDATVVHKLEAAGAVIVAKTNMDEFAMGSTSETSFYGAVKNPWDASRVPGGSSGGSAAAVAGGAAVCALGSDTGGSIRQPASYCGVTGMKPTYGTVSRYGLVAYASSLDQIGPICHDAADCAAVLDVISGWDRRDGTSLDFSFEGLHSSLGGDVK